MADAARGGIEPIDSLAGAHINVAEVIVGDAGREITGESLPAKDAVHEKFSTFLRNEICSNNLSDFRLDEGLTICVLLPASRALYTVEPCAQILNPKPVDDDCGQ